MLESILVLASAGQAAAGNRIFTGPGNFSDASKWDGPTVPSAGDNLAINGTCTFDSSANLAYGSIDIGSSSAGTLQFGGKYTLNVTAVSSSTAGSKIDMSGGGTLQITTSWATANQTFTPGTGTILWNVTGSATTLPSGIATYNNLTIDVGTTIATLGGDLAVNGTLTIKTGTLDVSTGNHAISVGGDWSNSGTFIPQSGTVTLNGSGDQLIKGTVSTTFKNMEIATDSHHTAYAYLSFGVTGTMTIDLNSTFTFNDKSFVINSGGAPPGSMLKGSGNLLITRTTTGTADLDNQCRFSSYALSSLTVQYLGAARAQTVSAHIYGNLLIGNSVGVSLGGAVTVNGTLTLTSGTLTVGGQILTLGGSVLGTASYLSASPGTVVYNGGAQNVAGVPYSNLTLSGSGPFTVIGLGTVSGTFLYASSASTTLTAPLTAGALTVNNASGTLNLGSGLSHQVNGAVAVAAGTLNLGSSTINGSSGTTLNANGKLSGTGAVGAVVINSGGVIQPGNSPGQINSGNETWNGGGSYVWEINDATGTSGSSTAGWSLLNMTGGIDVQATVANPFVIKPTSLSGATHFNNGNGYAWTMATVSGSITHFDPAKFIVNTNDFKNDMYRGKFSVQLSSDGKSVQLKFTPSCAGGLTTKSYEVVGDPDLGVMHLYFANPFGLADVTATRLDYASMTGNAYDSGGSLVGSVNSGSPLVKNSTYSLDSTYPLDSRATRLELIASHSGGTASWVNALVRDKQGTAAYWDPVMATLTVKRAGVLRKTFTGIPSAEHSVRVENGKPGLAWAALLVNGHLFVVNPLLAGEGVEVDVCSAMLPREENTVVVAGEGPVGATAFVLIGDSLTGQVRSVAETAGAEAADWRARIAQGYEDASSLVLAVRREGGRVVLSWPGEQTGCVVQAWSGSAPDQWWVDLAVTPELVAGRFTVILGLEEPLRLFRLYRP